MWMIQYFLWAIIWGFKRYQYKTVMEHESDSLIDLTRRTSIPAQIVSPRLITYIKREEDKKRLEKMSVALSKHRVELNYLS